MLTQWGGALNPEAVLPEYPRPQFQRKNFTILNGMWEYAITSASALIPPARFDGAIVVPFSPESELSGVGRTLKPTEALWYRRYLEAPLGFDSNAEDLLLHVGAADQFAEVRLNGMTLLNHAGGYLPFSVVLTEAMLPGTANELLIRVRDETDTGCWSRGKQSSNPGGIWYTPQSGIWQTVWLERAPKRRIENLRLTPLYDTAEIEIVISTNCNGSGTILLEGKDTPFLDGRPVRIEMEGFEPWSPEHPKLYDVVFTMERDRVESYFAMRKFSVAQDAAGIPRLFLNNEPYFHTGVLDQGYWPDGLYTAPSDEAMIYDITLMKSMGFNMMRKHIKIEPLRWYYHCDRLGMLVWQDAVNGGGLYRKDAISFPLIFGNSHPDSDYAYFSREEVRGREACRRELNQTIELLYNCPCIAMWVPFNEGWGQFDANKAVEAIRALDTTRTIDHASGWHDQGGGDVKSLHVYYKPYRFQRDGKGRAVVLSEFGGYSHHIAGHSFSEKEFGYKRCKTAEALMQEVERLYAREVIAAKPLGLCASVYTQLSDVEQETNGLVTYDRVVVKFDEARMRAINAKLLSDESKATEEAEDSSNSESE
ncbi:MAG: glycoside hydrolase family 2 [Eubacteriales bacterium]|nr:glycoside hydrolase family 2 [Eubacteriales bacterium]